MATAATASGDAATDQDLSVLGLSTKSGGQVAYRADRGVARAFGKAYLTEGRVTLRDPGTKTKVAAVAAPSGNQLTCRLAHRHRHVDRALGGVRDMARDR